MCMSRLCEDITIKLMNEDKVAIKKGFVELNLPHKNVNDTILSYCQQAESMEPQADFHTSKYT